MFLSQAAYLKVPYPVGVLRNGQISLFTCDSHIISFMLRTMRTNMDIDLVKVGKLFVMLGVELNQYRFRS